LEEKLGRELLRRDAERGLADRLDRLDHSEAHISEFV
jgi:hypothetical protein